MRLLPERGKSLRWGRGSHGAEFSLWLTDAKRPLAGDLGCPVIGHQLCALVERPLSPLWPRLTDEAESPVVILSG